jgi:hypothetical protein
VVKALVGAYGKGGGLLAMKRTAGLVFATRLFQLDAALDYLNDIGPIDQIIDEFLRDSACHAEGCCPYLLRFCCAVRP